MQKFENPELWFHTLGTHYLCAQFYFDLNQTGVITYLKTKGPVSTIEVCKALDLEFNILDPVLYYISQVDGIIEFKDGKYSITAFGQQVLKRYTRVDESEEKLNLYNVRIGGFRPVWENLQELLTRNKVYGQDVKRNNELVENGLYLLSPRLVDPVIKVAAAEKILHYIELGANSGIGDKILESRSDSKLVIIDRNVANLRDAKVRLESKGFGARAHFILSDIFDTTHWLDELAKLNYGKALIFTVHMHEFVRKGEPALISFLSEIKKNANQLQFLLLEQPLNTTEEKDKLTETQWLYSQSNVLIHHIINSGRILTMADWHEIYRHAGYKIKDQFDTKFLGFEAVHFI